ncbi:helix-turn-helix domain-containing protein [Rhodococcus opacus]|uniref:helix-turn-helix domain-containing protein n=1 Tax=Rhodococcus opacus TaxID=37919 RepID=UPI00247361A4|nr:helix-turn-helix transcriptional regulator [Rhodococcus opacus]MDH6293079.1 transcriptional regulator with XRE-family HTH domain [Rhodococcus opacus]
MDSRGDIREFLTTRRARLTPEQAGLPNFGGRRRVPGLRREEVALLAGMSVEYYVRLERGNATGVSEAVLDGISRALQLDDAEHLHLYDLVRAANQGARPRQRRKPSRQQVRGGVQQTIDAMFSVPVIVQNGRLDIVAANRLGFALFSEMYGQPQRPANFVRFVFLDPRAQTLYHDWEDAAQQTVALLRTEAGRAPYDRALTDLVGEVSTRSELFRTLWASHDVREHRTGTKRIHHPIVGDLELNYEGMDLTSDRGLLLLAYTAPPGSPSQERLQLLTSWAATSDQAALALPESSDTTDGR